MSADNQVDSQTWGGDDDPSIGELLQKALDRRKQKQFESANPLLSAQVHARKPLSYWIDESLPRADESQDVTTESELAGSTAYKEAELDGCEHDKPRARKVQSASAHPEDLLLKQHLPFAWAARKLLGRDTLPFKGERPGTSLLERIGVVRASGVSGRGLFGNGKRPWPWTVVVGVSLGSAAASLCFGAILLHMAQHGPSRQTSSGRVFRATTDSIMRSDFSFRSAGVPGSSGLDNAPSGHIENTREKTEEADAAVGAGSTDRFAQLRQRRYDRAQVLESVMRDQQKIVDLRKQVNMAPADRSARMRLAHALFEEGLFEDAAAQFEILQKAESLGTDEELLYASSLANCQQTQRAEDLLTSMLMKDKKNARVRAALIKLYLSCGITNAARSLCQEGIALAGSEADRLLFSELLNAAPGKSFADVHPRARHALKDAPENATCGG